MRVFWVVLVLAVVALAGCSGDDASTAERSVALTDRDVLADSDNEVQIGCGTEVQLIVAHSVPDEGDLTVTVRDGNGVLVWQESYGTESEGEDRRDLTGGTGTWTLRVDRSLEFDDSFRVTLKC